jgi:ABC-2 type transport system ATP-binding protein
MLATPVIRTRGLTKYYGGFEAVKDLSLTVERGSITGFLGQNGAGKSSTLKMLLGIMKPSAGGGEVLGHDIADPAASVEMRRRTAYVAEDKRLYDYMTVRQIIRFTRAFYPGWRGDLEASLLDDFRLPLDRPIGKLSKGMRTQTALLLAFCRGSELLILDEPTEGLDPVVTERVLQLTVAAAADGATIFFSSHQISEVEQVADRVLIIDRGRLVLDTTTDAVKEEFRRIRIVCDAPEVIDLTGLGGVVDARHEGRAFSVIASQGIAAIAARLEAATGERAEVLPVTLKEVLLERVGPGR